MKIQTRLRFAIALSLVLAVTVATLAFISARSVIKTSIRAQRITNILSDITGLESVTHEYLHYFGGRSLVQFQSVYGSLLEDLGECCLRDPEEKILADRIISDLQSFKGDFFRLANLAKKEKETSRQEDGITRDLKERLLVQLMIKLQATASLATQLQRRVHSQLAATLDHTSLAIAASLSVLTALIIGVLLWVNRSIAKPITELRKGIQLVGAGKLDHKVGTEAKDEIGELSRAVDKMTEDLKRTTASIEDLNREIAERKRIEQALRESERKYRNILETTSEGCWMLDHRLKTVEVNESLCKMLGYSRSEMLGKTPFEFVDEENREIFLEQTSKISTTTHRSYEITLKKKNGEDLPVLLNATTIRDEQGKVHSAFAFVTDMAERKRLEAQLLQAQKMESVGRLAGGVAHDLNNTLSIILGYTELSLSDARLPESLRSELEEIRTAARRSSEVVRQLLAFARKQVISPKILNLNDAIESTLKMIRRLIGENIDLEWKPATDLWAVKMDPAQIDQILANLCINARDAIADVGKVIIETRNVVIDDAYCGTHAHLSPGRYVMLAVSDTGCGMDKEMMDKIFEPFFTTKEVGQGTGLGLATVHGIVKQNNGSINVYSELGRGTTFKIYLPYHADETPASHDTSPELALSKYGETVLLVEDDDSVRKLGKIMLERLGYTALTALTPNEAIELVKNFDGKIHLLITDVVMPQMNGRELAERIRETKPELKCLFMSGYTADVILHHGVLREGIDFIQKPFSIRDLAARVRKVLDQP